MFNDAVTTVLIFVTTVCSWRRSLRSLNAACSCWEQVLLRTDFKMEYLRPLLFLQRYVTSKLRLSDAVSTGWHSNLGIDRR